MDCLESSESTRCGPPVRIVVLVLTVVALLFVLPSLPAAWAGLTHFSDLNEAQGSVVVSHCERGALLVNWTCSGTWSANDPMATPINDFQAVVVNNPRLLPKGTNLGYVTAVPPSHDVYLAGGGMKEKVAVLWIAVVLLVCSLIMIGLGGRWLRFAFRGSKSLLGAAPLVLGLLLIVAVAWAGHVTGASILWI